MVEIDVFLKDIKKKKGFAVLLVNDYDEQTSFQI
jgi:hypothetical protein